MRTGRILRRLLQGGPLRPLEWLNRATEPPRFGTPARRRECRKAYPFAVARVRMQPSPLAGRSETWRANSGTHARHREHHPRGVRRCLDRVAIARTVSPQRRVGLQLGSDRQQLPTLSTGRHRRRRRRWGALRLKRYLAWPTLPRHSAADACQSTSARPQPGVDWTSTPQAKQPSLPPFAQILRSGWFPRSN